MPFGATIPVTGLNLGFLGQVSRLGKRTIVARQVLPSTTNAIQFGQGVVITNASGAGPGGSYQSIADFIAGGGTFTAAKFAGVAIREVKTQLQFNTLLQNSGVTIVGTYPPGDICEVLEEGSICVNVTTGTPASQGTVYVRIALNGSIPTGVIGDFEAAADGANTVALTGVVFRTGVLDANNTAEITILNRVAA